MDQMHPRPPFRIKPPDNSLQQADENKTWNLNK